MCNNHFKKLEQRYYGIYGKYAGRYRLQPHLTKLLKRTKKHWAWIPRDTLDAVIIRLDTTYQRFFNGLGGLPKFKRKDRYRSAKFQTGYKLDRGSVRLSFKEWDETKQKFVFVRRNILYHHHRDWKGSVRYIQILRDAVGTYWKPCIVTDDSTTDSYPATGESVGIDFGMDTYLTLAKARHHSKSVPHSDCVGQLLVDDSGKLRVRGGHVRATSGVTFAHIGEKIQHPQPLKRSLTELRTLNKALSRKVKGSNNWWRAVRQLARLYRKITNQRKDWHWKLATDLCQRFDTIVTETLNLEGMKRLWGRKVSDLSFGQFVEILKYKCERHNREFHQIGQWTATTKPCSDCGYHSENLSLADRQWICTECGSDHDRDINAAINILRAACGPVVETT